MKHDNKATLKHMFSLVELTRYLVHPMTCLYGTFSISRDSLMVLGASSKDSLQVVVSGVDIGLQCNMSKPVLGKVSSP